MTTPDNRALWELVEKFRRRAEIYREYYSENDYNDWDCAADELADLLERPVVVGDEFVYDVAQALYVNGWSSGGDFDEDFVPDVRNAITAALESMVRGKS